MQARPTEYAGVRFRSKSEAIVARCLDETFYLWDYEPPLKSGHPWDFILCHSHGGMELVEYKPRLPNQTYISELCEKHCGDYQFQSIKRSLIVGSPWNIDSFIDLGTYYVKYHLSENGITDLSLISQWNQIAESSKRFRFDLSIGSKKRLIKTSQIQLGGSRSDTTEPWRIQKTKAVLDSFLKEWKIDVSPIVSLYDSKGLLIVKSIWPLDCYTKVRIEGEWAQIDTDSPVEFITV